jgi:hypothetical protein
MNTDSKAEEAMTEQKQPDELDVQAKGEAAQIIAGSFKPERDYLGALVRRAWVNYCLEIGDHKTSHVEPYSKLSESDKEADRRIGEAIWMESEKRNSEPLRQEIIALRERAERAEATNANLLANLNGITDELEAAGYFHSQNPEGIKVILASVASLTAQVAAKEEELQAIDSVLSRRPALADCDSRADKINHACVTAGRATDEAFSLKRQLLAANQRADEAEGERDAANEVRVDANAARDDYAHTIDELCNYAWQRVYGEGPSDWEYPAQAIRHLVQFCDEKDKELALAQTELAAAKEQATERWLPIETAPESEYVLVFLPNYGHATATRTGRDWWAVNRGERINPTHWQPLPEPPMPIEATAAATQEKGESDE